MPGGYLRGMGEQVARCAGTMRDGVILAPVYGVLMFTLAKDPRLTVGSGIWWTRTSPAS